MKQISVRRSVSIWILLLLAACSKSLQKDVCGEMNFALIDVESVTEIKLHKTNGPETSENTIAILNTNDQVSAVHRFLMSNESDWVADPFGVPVASYRAVFWSESTRLESVSFGPSFFVSQGCGYFFAANSTETEINDFVSLFGVHAEDTLDFGPPL